MYTVSIGHSVLFSIGHSVLFSIGIWAGRRVLSATVWKVRIDVAATFSGAYGTSTSFWKVNKQTNKIFRCGCTKAAKSKRPNTAGSNPISLLNGTGNTTEMAKGPTHNQKQVTARLQHFVDQ